MMIKIWFTVFFGVLTSMCNALEFDCQKLIASSNEFTHCENKIGNYPEVVHVYIPKNLDSTKPINLNIHFHGHNIEGYNHYLNMGELLVSSESNSILMIPSSLGKCTTYDQYFSNYSRTQEFLQSALKFSEIPFNTLSFSGHSGAYRVLRTIFSYDGLEEKLGVVIKGVGLFDATYSNIDSIISFALKQRTSGFVFYDSFVSGDAGTADEISMSLKRKYSSETDFYFYPVKSTKDSVLVQHFNLLQVFGISEFLKLLF